jgi:hypothetical protein
MFDLKKKQLLFDMLQNLNDLNTIDAVIEGGGVELMGSLLHDSSAQIRKYAVAVIAQLCISVKGQLHIIRILHPTQQPLALSSQSSSSSSSSSVLPSQTSASSDLSPSPKQQTSTKTSRKSPTKQQTHLSPGQKKNQRTQQNSGVTKSDTTQSSRTMSIEAKNALIPTVINMLKVRFEGRFFHIHSSYLQT